MGGGECGSFQPTKTQLLRQSVLVIPQTELRRRVTKGIAKAGIEFSCHDAVIIPIGVDLEDVIAMLGADTHLTGHQLEQIRIFDFDPGSSDLAWLSTATTAQKLLVSAGSSQVEECLQREAIETHFQPIVATASKQVIGYEALSRGRTSSGSMIAPDQLFSYAQQTDSIFFLDRLCRETSIRTAASRELQGRLFVNFLPNAIYDPRQCLKTTLAIADASGFDPRRIVFEVTESEQIIDFSHLKEIFRYYRSHGFQVALDDVGSGYAGLNTLVALVPDVIKLDRELIQDIDREPFKRSVAAGLIKAARGEGIEVVAEGVETIGELSCVVDLGASLVQGYVFARPSADPIREIEWPNGV